MPLPVGEAMDECTGKVFVIDDDESVRKGLSRLLAAEGFQVEAFASAREYLQRGPCEGLACVLLDVQMPGLSGLELQALMKEQDDDLPIVFLTAHGDIPKRVRVMKNGAVDFLTKPVHVMPLLEAIRQALLRHRQSLRARTATD
jgi:FixJ family two-component response regulator